MSQRDSVTSFLKTIKWNLSECQSIGDLVPFVSQLFDLDELRQLMMKKITKLENNVINRTNYNQSRSNICKIFFNSTMIDDIFPKEIMCKIVQYLDNHQLETLPLVSKNFYQYIYDYDWNNPNPNPNANQAKKCPQMLESVS